MKKISVIIIILILCSCLLTFKFYNKNNIEEVLSRNTNHKDILGMMIETDAGSGKYEMTTMSSWPTDGYIFNTKFSKCENGGKLVWDDTNKKVVFEGNNIDKCYVYFDVYVPPKNISEVCSDGDTLSSCIVSLATRSTPSITGIYYHDSTLTNGAGDNSYRYAGNFYNVYNFVIFGELNKTFPSDNLYRIIGVFNNKVKLIKYDYAISLSLGDDDYSDNQYLYSEQTSYIGDLTRIDRFYWDNVNEYNTWSKSSLNTTSLNNNFISNIGYNWESKISDTTWKVGGNLYKDLVRYSVNTGFQNEIVNPITKNSSDNAIEFNAKVGLVYASDYGYAADPSFWSGTLYNYANAKSNNWMYMGLDEWTITRAADYANSVLYINAKGGVDQKGPGADIAVRPVFYLVDSVTYKSGIGTAADPIIIN